MASHRSQRRRPPRAMEAAMDADERQIRELLDTWWRATKTDDVDTVLDLMADDVMFLTPGQEPFGKIEFEKAVLIVPWRWTAAA